MNKLIEPELNSVFSPSGDILVLYCSHFLQQKRPNQNRTLRACPEGGDRLIPICVTSHNQGQKKASQFQIGGHIVYIF